MNPTTPPGPPKNAIERFYARTKKMTSKQCWFALSVVVVVLSTICIVLTQAIEILGQDKMKLLIDTDGGTDDAMALLYLLNADRRAKNINFTDGPEILGVTCVHGITHIDNVQVNVLKMLQSVGRLDIPVYKGAERPILKKAQSNTFFGRDGMGDVYWPNPPSLDLIQNEHAVDALIRLADENPGEITLLALGPLTNIALATRMDETFSKKLKKLVILGGAVQGRGNVEPGVEFNFFMDPEANYIVLNGTDYNPNTVLLVTWDVVLTTDISFDWRREELGEVKSPEVTILNKLEHIDKYPDDGQWRFADPIAAAVTLNESLVTRMESYPVEAVTEGAFRGGLLVDYSNLRKSDKKIDIVYSIDREGYEESLIEHFS